MRFLAGLGALLFAYLALIPAGLIVSVLDSACSGAGCETSPLSQITFTLMYALCLIAVLGTAALFAHHALRGTHETQERLPRALLATAVVIGAATFVLFCFAYPLGGGIAAALAVAGYLTISLAGRRVAEADPRSNGHRVNGSGAWR